MGKDETPTLKTCPNCGNRSRYGGVCGQCGGIPRPKFSPKSPSAGGGGGGNCLISAMSLLIMPFLGTIILILWLR
jgi:hypothetical protein